MGRCIEDGIGECIGGCIGQPLDEVTGLLIGRGVLEVDPEPGG